MLCENPRELPTPLLLLPESNHLFLLELPPIKADFPILMLEFAQDDRTQGRTRRSSTKVEQSEDLKTTGEHFWISTVYILASSFLLLLHTMETGETKKTSIDSLPYEMAELVAEEIHSWGEGEEVDFGFDFHLPKMPGKKEKEQR